MFTADPVTGAGDPGVQGECTMKKLTSRQKILFCVYAMILAMIGYLWETFDGIKSSTARRSGRCLYVWVIFSGN